MADHHMGDGVPIGGVIAHESLVSPSGVGYDIGCGTKRCSPMPMRPTCAPTSHGSWDDVWSTISFGLARKNKEPVDHELFDDNDDDAWQIKQDANSATWRLTSLRDMARAQLGTVGSGTSMSSKTNGAESGSVSTSAPAASATRSPPGF
jgi:tRNA-splicing ligase RtcB